MNKIALPSFPGQGSGRNQFWFPQIFYCELNIYCWVYAFYPIVFLSQQLFHFFLCLIDWFLVIYLNLKTVMLYFSKWWKLSWSFHYSTVRTTNLCRKILPIKEQRNLWDRLGFQKYTQLFFMKNHSVLMIIESWFNFQSFR